MYTRLPTPPPERPRLQLQPRTKPPEDTSGGRERGEGGRASSSIFGQAKPVDTVARDREIEERLLRVSKFSLYNYLCTRLTLSFIIVYAFLRFHSFPGKSREGGER